MTTKTRVEAKPAVKIRSPIFDRFNYTEWRRHGLPDVCVKELAASANDLSSHMDSAR